MIQAVSDPRVARRLVAGVATPTSDEGACQAAACAAWSSLVEPGDRVAGRLVAVLGPLLALRSIGGQRCPVDDVATAREWSDARARWEPRLSLPALETALEAARRSGAFLLQPTDLDWPDALDDLGDHRPLCLWVRGDRARLTRGAPAVALVGARAASGYGEHVAGELAARLAEDGVAVVSGAAYGIDGAAHRAALSAGGLTIAFLAGGVDRPYPAGHADLITQIARRGLLMSEVPPGSAPTKWRFLQRNRLIAAVSDATVVVEAGWRSGSLNTAGHAAALGRPLGAVPGQVTSAASAGCHRLLRDYDARCITGPADVRELLGAGPEEVQSEASCHRTDDRTRVRDALSTRVWRESTEVARRAGMAPADVEGHLGLLHLDGEVERGSQGWRATARAASAS